MKNVKYKFTNKTKNVHNKILKQIVCVAAFADVKVGQIGGWIESENNLSHKGKCWVSENACVFGNAWVSGNALVSNNAEVSAYAWVFLNSWVSENAEISGNAQVFDNAEVSGNARISADAVFY